MAASLRSALHAPAAFTETLTLGLKKIPPYTSIPRETHPLSPAPAPHRRASRLGAAHAAWQGHRLPNGRGTALRQRGLHSWRRHAVRPQRPFHPPLQARQAPPLHGGLRNQVIQRAHGRRHVAHHAQKPRVIARHSRRHRSQNQVFAQKQPCRRTHAQGHCRQKAQRPPHLRLLQHRQVLQNHLRLQRGDRENL